MIKIRLVSAASVVAPVGVELPHNAVLPHSAVVPLTLDPQIAVLPHSAVLPQRAVVPAMELRFNLAEPFEINVADGEAALPLGAAGLLYAAQASTCPAPTVKISL